ncbi:gliding motility-associated ABC transporter ATP-binding subunit GldA [Solitalea canadensis]|uniref:Gliding motility-associated ABC transporter ATP-binding subunit GldA n=1 Tax=Solitalea canadensis (strain ATCC 29591 / DSM 3403 / JCM 21819 / LMG 8368 / NBRC 15130 / NCIMB 12057 / USAM 9D) TaxID=929556 RepID=H8KP00_SOLCM|nr:gliding motility-associated ABC transporter ATP-binding subunit GldA [Solitalea canadensis]AFD05522.1 gliding motility-associated ABC transporter ATP-binding subunit GldA [Solitalea canadensis DSM 3403]
MSVIVEQLTKQYKNQIAVNSISFEAQPGRIMGFLGPNGAGKSTTMKMLTGYIPPTSGKATVCGFDIVSQSLDVRRNIGYLPEHNPLYLEMYVKESLAFTAQMHKITNAGKRISEVIELTGLGIEQHKKIGQLSKGYRQRVGLAQAIIHDPKVLILDEPTTGLDPNQLIEIRSLIKTIGQEKTVIFSTHIMQEVEAICDQVVIINNGLIVANDQTSNLKQLLAGSKTYYVEFDKEVSAEKLQEIEGVSAIEFIGTNSWKITSGQDIRGRVFEFAKLNDLALLSSKQEENSLEDIFRTLTK